MARPIQTSSWKYLIKKTANAFMNNPLSWALRGGGGGNWDAYLRHSIYPESLKLDHLDKGGQLVRAQGYSNTLIIHAFVYFVRAIKFWCICIPQILFYILRMSRCKLRMDRSRL